MLSEKNNTDAIANWRKKKSPLRLSWLFWFDWVVLWVPCRWPKAAGCKSEEAKEKKGQRQRGLFWNWRKTDVVSCIPIVCFCILGAFMLSQCCNSSTAPYTAVRGHGWCAQRKTLYPSLKGDMYILPSARNKYTRSRSRRPQLTTSLYSYRTGASYSEHRRHVCSW